MLRVLSMTGQKETHMSRGRFFVASVLLSLVPINMGCLVGGHSKVKQEGTYVAESTLNHIQPGKSTAAFVLATLGQPTEKAEMAPGHQLWKYSYKETKDSSGYVLFVFGGAGSEVKKQQVFVELENGVVTRTWRG
jgi:outer membrane protein assembly factor BamE (lipoprotein component of BamABCDE complex)